MGGVLPYDQVRDSFWAVQRFLRHAGHRGQHNVTLSCTVEEVKRHHRYEDSIEFECRDYVNNQSYILYSDLFKANNYHRPVWSAYHQFHWNDQEKYLEIKLENIHYRFKNPKI